MRAAKLSSTKTSRTPVCIGKRPGGLHLACLRLLITTARLFCCKQTQPISSTKTARFEHPSLCVLKREARAQGYILLHVARVSISARVLSSSCVGREKNVIRLLTIKQIECQSVVDTNNQKRTHVHKHEHKERKKCTLKSANKSGKQVD